MKKLELTPDVLELLERLQYWPESRQFTWSLPVSNIRPVNWRAGGRIGNLCYITYRGKRYRVDHLADLVEADHNLCLSPTAHP